MTDINGRFFEKHQRAILFMANHAITGWLLGIHRLPKNFKRRGICFAKITPGSVHYATGNMFIRDGVEQIEYKTLAFTRPRFAEALAYNLSPFAYLRTRSTGYTWHISPVGALAMLLMALTTKLSGLPVIFFGTTTDYYAGAGDGSVLTTGARSDASGSNTYDTDDRMVQDMSSPFRMVRSGFPIDTSGIPDDATISAADFKFYCTLLYQTDSTYKLSLVQSTQASTSSIATSDFSKLYGTLDSDTKLNTSDLVSTSMTSNAYNTFSLNSTGLSYISKTGYTKFAIRSSYDIDNSGSSTTERQINTRYSQYTGTTYDPYISVTYTTGTNYTKDIAETVTLVEVIARLPGKAISEAAAIVETLYRSTTRTILEAATAVGTATNVFVYARAMQDTITLIETTASRIAGFTHTEIITLQETLAKAMGRAISEAATMQETVARGLVYARTILETATTVEVVAYIKSLGRLITEQITIVARLRSLLNGLDTRWIGKYASKAGTFISKYLDPKSS